MTGAGTVQLRRWSEADFAAAQPVWAGLVLPMPLLVSHS